MTEKEQLLPCPFCGGDDVKLISGSGEDGFGDVFAMFDIEHCCELFQQTLRIECCSTSQEAINKWNTRAISADEKEQIRRLKAFADDVLNINDAYECFASIEASAIQHCLLEVENEKSFLYKKADWLNDENDN